VRRQNLLFAAGGRVSTKTPSPRSGRLGSPRLADRGRLHRRLSAGLVLSAVLLSASGALADQRTEAKSHFKKGMGAIAEGKYEEGISELQRAYEILPHPNVLYNIARAYAESGDLEGAVATYKKYLEGNPADKDEVAQVVGALEGRLERQKAIAAAAGQVAPTPTPGATPGATPGTVTPGVTPGGPTPGPVVTGPVGPTPTPGLPPPIAAPINVGQAKTEDVFEESVVTASKGAQSPLDAPNSTSIITEQDIRLSGLVQIPDLLRRLAGVDVMETTNSQTEVSMRGFNQAFSNKILVLINGRSVFVDLLGATYWALLPIGVEDIERIEVVRGPGSALYGADAFNGVINIITKTPGEGKSGFSALYGDHNTAHGTAYASGRDKEVAYRMSAGFDNFPRWSNDVNPARVDEQTAAPNYGGQQNSQQSVRLNADITRDMGHGVVVGVGAGYVHAAYEIGPYAPLTDLVFYTDSADATAFLTSKHFELHGFYNTYRGQNSLDSDYIGQTLLPAEYNLNVADVEAQYIDDERTKVLDNSLHIGLGYRYKEATLGYLPDGQIVENWESAYIHDEFGIGRLMGTRRQFALVGDIRGDYVPYLGKIVPSPKGSILFHPSENSTIRGIVATAFRIPTFLEGYLDIHTQLPVAGGSLHSISTDPSTGSTRLNPEQVVTEELGYLNQSEFFTFDSAFFHNYVTNLIELAPLRSITVGDLATGNPASNYDPPSNTYPLFYGGYQNQCQSNNVYGAELGVRAFPVDGLDFYANYTFMNVKTDTSGCNAAQLAGYVPDQRTSAHKINAGVQVRTKIGQGGIDASLDFNYVSAQDWALQIANAQAQKIEYEPFHIDPYAVFNGRVGYRFFKNKADIGVILNNIGNAQHKEYPLSQPVGQRIMGTFAYRF
jgi:outer membrane receptor for ferrienterochelin and colicin